LSRRYRSLSQYRISNDLVWPTWDCGTGQCFCYIHVLSCLFLSPNPIIVFLQLCDMSDAVLDTCEGDFQGKLDPAHLASLPPASPASCPAATCLPAPPAPSSVCMWSRPTNRMPASLLPAFPSLGRDHLSQGPLWHFEVTGLSLFPLEGAGAKPGHRVLALLSYLFLMQPPSCSFPSTSGLAFTQVTDLLLYPVS
jgi:hypothetical protein